MRDQHEAVTFIFEKFEMIIDIHFLARTIIRQRNSNMESVFELKLRHRIKELVIFQLY